MIEYDGIRNIDQELVALDETKPIIFLDIDGVVNPIRRQRKWVGPDSLAGGQWDPELYKASNWKLEELTHDPELHYPVSRKLTVDIDRWFDLGEHMIEWNLSQWPEKRYKTLTINLMDEMLDELRELVEKFGFQVVYLTYWRSEALRLLEPELRLGATAYLDWNTRSDRGHRLKIDALQDFYERTDIRTPFVILDDESTAGLKSDADLWYSNPRYADRNPEKAAQVKELNTIPKLVFQQAPEWGIERAHLEEIRKFAESLSS